MSINNKNWENLRGHKAKYSQSTKTALNYFYENNIPITVIYNDGSKDEDLELISYDQFNILFRGKEEDFVVLKHSIKKLVTGIDLKQIIEVKRDPDND